MDLDNSVSIAIEAPTENQANAVVAAVRYGLSEAGFENVGFNVMSSGSEDDPELQYEAPPTPDDLDRIMGGIRDEVPDLQIAVVGLYEQADPVEE